MQSRHLGERFRFHGDGHSRERALEVPGLPCAGMLGRAKEQRLAEPGGPLRPAARLPSRHRSRLAHRAANDPIAGRPVYHLLLVTLADGLPRPFWFDVTGVA